MINKFSLVSILFLFQTTAFAGGGSVIGNGAGIAENNFQYAYNSLNSTIAECLETQKCEMSQPELKILTAIRGVIQKNISNQDRILFVSEKQFPGFFDTGISEKHRIAKTGLTTDIPIYVNTDLLYTDEGQPAFDFAAVSSILAHEIGHQTGEENHAKLDIIGSKLRNVISQKITAHDIVVGTEQKKVEITIMNQVRPFQSSEMYIAWQDVGSTSLTPDLIHNIECSQLSSTLSGIEIQNGHFTSVTQDENANFIIGFGVWINISCFSNRDAVFYNETKAVDFIVNEDLSLKVTSVKTISATEKPNTPSALRSFNADF